jgi:putative transposase
MRKSRFSTEQIVGILHEVEAGAKITEVCRRHGITDTTIQRCRRKYGGLQVSEARRLVAQGGLLASTACEAAGLVVAHVQESLGNGAEGSAPEGRSRRRRLAGYQYAPAVSAAR